MTDGTDTLLSVEHLRVAIAPRKADEIPIVHDVDFTVSRGEVVGVVGESGSGKSMTTRAIMRLLPERSVTEGRISFAGEDILTMSPKSLSAFRTHRVGMIYQDPRAHTNPVRTVGEFLIEGAVASRQLSRREAVDKAVRLLAEVGIADGRRRMGQYPHQLSGGLLQRMMIVMTLMTDPELIIADEATTALDVTVQADVVGVFRQLKESRGMALLFITHDLDLAASIADMIVVMYAGRVVERGAAQEVYTRPSHPYTAALLRSRPDPRSRARLQAIPGRPIAASEAGQGCAFATRCPFAREICRSTSPPLRAFGDGGMVACHRAEEIAVEMREMAV